MTREGGAKRIKDRGGRRWGGGEAKQGEKERERVRGK